MPNQLKIAINGFGRIGRIAFRNILKENKAKVVAVNDLIPVDQLAYLLKYDSVHGTFDGDIGTEDGNLIVNGNRIRVTAETQPEKLAWGSLDTDVVMECTGLFKTHEKAAAHLRAGSKKVVISAPSTDAPMYVMGVNHKRVNASEKIVSNASCTTNCLAVLAKVAHDHYGIAEGLMTTVHATTNSQTTVDSPSKKNFRLGRSALCNIIPTTTGAAQAVTKVIPALKGRLSGMALRVPVTDVSVVDLTFRTEKPTTLDAIKKTFKSASENELSGILGYTDEEVVSQDFVSDSRSCIFDAGASMELNGHFFKLVSWYDNEFGYASRLVDLTLYISSLNH